jgi:hypothetical protein
VVEATKSSVADVEPIVERRRVTTDSNTTGDNDDDDEEVVVVEVDDEADKDANVNIGNSTDNDVHTAITTDAASPQTAAEALSPATPRTAAEIMSTATPTVGDTIAASLASDTTPASGGASMVQSGSARQTKPTGRLTADEMGAAMKKIGPMWTVSVISDACTHSVLIQPAISLARIQYSYNQPSHLHAFSTHTTSHLTCTQPSAYNQPSYLHAAKRTQPAISLARSQAHRQPAISLAHIERTQPVDQPSHLYIHTYTRVM